VGGSEDGLAGRVAEEVRRAEAALDLVFALELSEGDLERALKNMLLLHDPSVRLASLAALASLRSGEKRTALARALSHLKSEVREVMALAALSSKSTVRALRGVPDHVAERAVSSARLTLRKFIDKLTMIMAVAFLSPVILGLSNLFRRPHLLDTMVTVAAFALAIELACWLATKRAHPRALATVGVSLALPLIASLAFVCLSEWWRLTIYSAAALLSWRLAPRVRVSLRRRYSELESLYLKLSKGLAVHGSIERALVEAAAEGVAASGVDDVARAVRSGTPLSRAMAKARDYGLASAIWACSRGGAKSAQVLEGLVRAVRVKSRIASEVEAELRTIEFRARAVSAAVLTSLALLTLCSAYVLSPPDALRILCSAYLNSALLFSSSAAFFRLLYGGRGALAHATQALATFHLALTLASMLWPLPASGPLK